jgi:hypothetical protein
MFAAIARFDIRFRWLLGRRSWWPARLSGSAPA